MAKDCTESSVATSPSTPPPNWWDLRHASSRSSWATTNSPWQNQNANSNSSCEEEVSISTTFTYASNQSGLTVESSQRLVEPASSNKLNGEHTPDNHLWSHVFSRVGSNGDLHNSQDVGENFVDALSSKSIPTGIFEPAAYDYLKKMDNNWEFTNSSSFSDFDKHLNGFTTESSNESERFDKLSNLVSHWSIAPPDPELNCQFDLQTCHISLSSSMDHQYSQANTTCHLKPRFTDSTSSGAPKNSGLFSYYGQDSKVENEPHDCEAPTSFFRKSFNNATTNGLGYHVGLNSTSMMESDNKYYYGMSHSQCTSARNFSDVTTFSSRLTKPLIGVNTTLPLPYYKSLDLSYCKKPGRRTSSLTITNGRDRVTLNESKKKRSEETSSEAVLKKPKTETSTTSSVKTQVPKVKLADRITALQQIVSPFGKTDTASVLYETIMYIKSLQEQVQLLSNPYMKSNSHKDSWGSLERKDKGDVKIDMRSRGLCLVPISYTPKVCHENTGTDYWTPTYRGCFYG